MKKLLLSLLALTMIAGCSSKPAETAPATEPEAATETTEETKMFKIGAIQLVEHVALDSATEGFIEGLKENGFEDGVNITIDLQNAQGAVDNCDTIVNKFVNDQVDLIFANATPAAQAAAAKTSETPIIITSVTDPQSAGLVNDNANPGTNVTGTSDLNPVKEQIELITTLLPETKTVAVMYCSSEDNSVFQAKLAQEAIEAAGMTFIDAPVADFNSIQSVTESLVGKADCLYLPTDNLLAENMTSVAQVANANKLPTVVGEEGMCANGAFATYSLDYFNLGKLAGEMAAKVLNGEDVSTMPIGYLASEDCTLVINTTTAEELGINLSEEVLASAKVIK